MSDYTTLREEMEELLRQRDDEHATLFAAILYIGKDRAIAMTHAERVAYLRFVRDEASA